MVKNNCLSSDGDASDDRKLGRRFIAEAESYLASKLNRRECTWSSHCDPKSRGMHVSPRRNDRPPQHSATRIYLATIITVGCNDQGLIEDTAIVGLIGTLWRVGDDPDSADIIVDLNKVKSLTAQLFNVIDAFHQYCRIRKKRVVLCGGGVNHAAWLRNANAHIAWFVSIKQATRHLIAEYSTRDDSTP